MSTPAFLCFLISGFVFAGSVRGGTPAITGRDVVPPAPDWVHRAVVYQIYPQTFHDSNGDGVGDLPGITAKLDYIRSLGADAIWINPFFDSPFNDAGYDIRDYYRIAPRYGTNDDARRLFAEAHRRGLKVLFDYVITYTAIDHPWFVESASGRPGPHTNWYVWTDNAWKLEPGARWVHGYGRRNGNFLSNFFWCQPALNYGFVDPDPAKPWQLSPRHPDVRALRAEMQHVMRFWMDLGADGFRADMANAMVKGESDRRVDPDTLGYWREVRQILDRDYPQAFTVAEWSDPESALDGAFHAAFFHWADGFNDLYQKESWRILNGMSEGHSFFDREGLGDVDAFLRSYLPGYLASRAHGYTCLPIGNHDIARVGNNRTVDELEMLTAFGLTMPGVPFLYYGTEIGMRQLHDLPQVEGAYKPRAGARTPMQWAPGANLGFSSAAPEKLYLPVDAAPDAPTVAAQEDDPDSLLNRTRRLTHLKHTEPALAAYAEFVPLYAQPHTYPFVFTRASGSAVLLVAFNPADRAVSAEFDFTVAHDGFELLAGRAAEIRSESGRLRLDLAPRSYAIYRVVRSK
ncbi:MAG TPA: alpha-amylase family glycosyl hydrolase [Opitutaceae bacterium]|nr:alpha-amylase family glycosyl hydrolase [Opitutaceae bacterium]